MYRIKIESNFSSAHNLRGYKGKCEGLHGHNWKVQVVVRATKLDKIGMAMDFKSLKKELKTVLEALDHLYLNKIPYFTKINPTSENIAKYIYDRVFDRINTRGCGLEEVTVWENETSSATYCRDDR